MYLERSRFKLNTAFKCFKVLLKAGLVLYWFFFRFFQLYNEFVRDKKFRDFYARGDLYNLHITLSVRLVVRYNSKLAGRALFALR